MDEEKFERAFDVILRNQAQFYSDLQQLHAGQKEAKKERMYWDVFQGN